jgi:predicted DNA-binding protein YlxM (UPF0122 family)
MTENNYSTDHKGKHWTHDERVLLKDKLKVKKPIAQIARELGRSRQSVYDEIERGTEFEDVFKYKHLYRVKRPYNVKLADASTHSQKVFSKVPAFICFKEFFNALLPLIKPQSCTISSDSQINYSICLFSLLYIMRYY